MKYNVVLTDEQRKNLLEMVKQVVVRYVDTPKIVLIEKAIEEAKLVEDDTEKKN